MRLARISGLRILAIALACICVPQAYACLNTFGAKILHGTKEQVATAVSELKQAHAAKPTLENSNDFGVALILNRDYDAAIKLLRETDQIFPGSAKVAANLGTALELQGNDEEALTWIREGVKRDATEHYGSEWLHGRVLEAKIALKKEPNWFEKNHVLDLDFGTGEVPVAPEILPVENGKLKGADQLVTQIGYQLSERTKFVSAPDVFVGDLFGSMSDLIIAGALSPLDGGKRDPVSGYQRALEYDAPHADLIRKRLARYQADLAAMPSPPVANKDEAVADYPVISQRFDRTPSRLSSLWIYIGAAAALTILLVAVGAIFDHRRRKRLEANPPPPIPDIDY
jgi:tetratricopeptide (TPR) repeat protein